jgi:hypothetical protein
VGDHELQRGFEPGRLHGLRAPIGVFGAIPVRPLAEGAFHDVEDLAIVGPEVERSERVSVGELCRLRRAVDRVGQDPGVPHRRIAAATEELGRAVVGVRRRLSHERGSERPRAFLRPAQERRADAAAPSVGMHGRLRATALVHLGLRDDPSAVDDDERVGREVEARTAPVGHDVLELGLGHVLHRELRCDVDRMHGRRVVGHGRPRAEIGGEVQAVVHAGHATAAASHRRA